jgi:hypothetical protein
MLRQLFSPSRRLLSVPLMSLQPPSYLFSLRIPFSFLFQPSPLLLFPAAPTFFLPQAPLLVLAAAVFFLLQGPLLLLAEAIFF